jgi:acetate kinase
MSILVINTGSSSLKFSLFDNSGSSSLLDGQIDWKGDGLGAELTVRQSGRPDRKSPTDVTSPATAAHLAITRASEGLPNGDSIQAIGHRVVHGGIRFLESTRIDAGFESTLSHLTELAPLHNPPAFEAIEATEKALPDVPAVAVFDTSFFANLPRSAAIYPVPWEWHEKYGIRRFGFHGISHSFCAGRAAEILGRDPSSLRLVICHLGNGCSASAVQAGVAIDTTMGFTPLDGLMMGTRSGEVDPGVLIYLIKEKGLNMDQIDDALNHQSGLLGVTGLSSDYRTVEEAANSGNDQAKLALEIYSARVKAAIGRLAATLGGIDALIFAAGVGENSATLRASATSGLGFMGVEIDPAKNLAHPVDADIASDDSSARILVIHTREDLMIAREVRRVLGIA